MKSDEIRQKIAAVPNQPLEKHGELFAEINGLLSEALQEIESA
jgi:hypothetical protein